jgi:hypothetical protein
MTLDLIVISDLTLDELISFREREEKSGGGSLADLRHNYVDSIENHVSSLRQPGLSHADREELRRQFQSKMKNDLSALRQELKLAGTKFALSTAVVTVIVGAAMAAASALGMSLGFPPAVTSTSGVAMGVGGILSQGLDYATSRKTLMQKHPMAYMYELQNFTC